MSEPITLAQAKLRLKLESDDTDRDAEVALLIPAARRAVENETGLVIVGDAPTFAPADLPVILIAILLQVEDWFVNGVAASEVSAPVRAVLGKIRTWVLR